MNLALCQVVAKTANRRRMSAAEVLFFSSRILRSTLEEDEKCHMSSGLSLLCS